MYVFMQKITVLIWQGNSKAPKNYKPFTLETECKWLIFGVFRRGNKPSVLPRDSKTSGATTKMARQMPSRKTKKKRRTSSIIVIVWRPHYYNTGDFSNEIK